MRLCLLNTSLCEKVICELLAGSTTGHFGSDKTIAMFEDNFYWPSLKKIWPRLFLNIANTFVYATLHSAQIMTGCKYGFRVCFA